LSQVKGKDKPVFIEDLDRLWETQSEFREHVRGILASAPLDQPLTGDAATVVHWLLHRHPNLREKIGSGLGHFEVRLNVTNDRAFYLRRVDGSVVDFSYRKCINSNRRESLDKRAARETITAAISTHKQRYFAGRPRASCEGCGEPNTMLCMEVHHEGMAFSAIFDLIAAADLDLSTEKGAGKEVWFTDSETTRVVQEFHNALIAEGHTTLRVLCTPCHNAAHDKTYRSAA
jgi:hypothetical protein